MFDVEQFLQVTTDEATSTEMLNPHDGYEGVGVITKVAGRSGTIGKGERNGEPYMAVDVSIEFSDVRIQEAVKRSKWTGRYGLMLDLTSAGAIDMSPGMNVKLGRLRAAVGQNIAGQPWGFKMLEGKTLHGKVKRRIADDGKEYCDVTEVTAL